MQKLGNGIVGIILVLYGIATLINPVYNSRIYQATFDMSNVKWPLGLLFILAGIVFLFFAFKNKLSTCPWICPECEEIDYLICDETEKRCKSCGHNMEKLKGFYDKKSNQ